MPVQRHPVDLRKMYERTCSKRSRTFPFENIDKFSSSSLVTRLTTDVNQYEWPI